MDNTPTTIDRLVPVMPFLAAGLGWMAKKTWFVLERRRREQKEAEAEFRELLLDLSRTVDQLALLRERYEQLSEQHSEMLSQLDPPHRHADG